MAPRHCCPCTGLAEQPFAWDKEQFALWAAHDCDDYNLMLTVVIEKKAQANLITYVGAELSDEGCSESAQFDNLIICQFQLLAGGDNFAMLFKGGFTPIFYTLAWEETEVGFDDFDFNFNWW